MLAQRAGAPAEPRDAEHNLWGLPVDRLRYTIFSWQRVTPWSGRTCDMTRLVLASASPGRRKVLRQAGIDPLVIVSGSTRTPSSRRLTRATPGDVMTALAAAKAEAVAQT